MSFSRADIEELRHEVKNRLSKSRYFHTLGVEKTARELGEIFIPTLTEELAVAALLHDIAKELDKEEQLLLLKGKDVDFESVACLHAFCAPELIKKDFEKFATDNVLSATFKHTSGDKDMSVFDLIIFISDYIEPGRSHQKCIELREFLLTSLSLAKSLNEKLYFLRRSCLIAIENTISKLKEKNIHICELTFLAKKSISALI